MIIFKWVAVQNYLLLYDSLRLQEPVEHTLLINPICDDFNCAADMLYDLVEAQDSLVCIYYLRLILYQSTVTTL